MYTHQGYGQQFGLRMHASVSCHAKHWALLTFFFFMSVIGCSNYTITEARPHIQTFTYRPCLRPESEKVGYDHVHDLRNFKSFCWFRSFLCYAWCTLIGCCLCHEVAIKLNQLALVLYMYKKGGSVKVTTRTFTGVYVGHLIETHSWCLTPMARINFSISSSM